MKLWCQITIPLTRCAGRKYQLRMLYTQVEFPFIIPIDSSIELPTPTEWREFILSAKITGYRLAKGEVMCEATMRDTLEEKDLGKLKHIGYTRDDPRNIF